MTSPLGFKASVGSALLRQLMQRHMSDIYSSLRLTSGAFDLCVVYKARIAASRLPHMRVVSRGGMPGFEPPTYLENR